MGRILQIAQLGHPVFRQRVQQIEDVSTASILSLIEDMLATVEDANGVGLAAPQVYESKCLIIVASHPNPRYPYAPEMKPTVMINPEITWRSNELFKDWEGCLSVPGIRGIVPRPTKIKMLYQDRDGKKIETEYSDFVARVVLHECDHLDGISFLERIENPKEIAMDKEYQKLIANC